MPEWILNARAAAAGAVVAAVEVDADDAVVVPAGAVSWTAAEA